MDLDCFWGNSLGDVATVLNGRIAFDRDAGISSWNQTRSIVFATVKGSPVLKSSARDPKAMLTFPWEKEEVKIPSPEELEAKKNLFEKQDAIVRKLWQGKT